MKFEPCIPPREFTVGRQGTVRMADCGRMRLKPDEQVTFVTESGAEYDVARKSWGFYATPSLNGRLKEFGLRPALVRNPVRRRYFILLVERSREQEFRSYLEADGLDLVLWLDEERTLNALTGGATPS